MWHMFKVIRSNTLEVKYIAYFYLCSEKQLKTSSDRQIIALQAC